MILTAPTGSRYSSGELPNSRSIFKERISVSQSVVHGSEFLDMRSKKHVLQGKLLHTTDLESQSYSWSNPT